MAGNAADLEILAHGEVSDGRAAPNFAGNATGVVVARTGAGTYTLTLDAGLPGAVAVTAAASRLVCQPTTTLQNVEVAKTSSTVFTVTTRVATTAAATDGTFDFVLYKATNVQT